MKNANGWLKASSVVVVMLLMLTVLSRGVWASEKEEASTGYGKWVRGNAGTGDGELCTELLELLNSLPKGKKLGKDFPFDPRFPKFQPAPMEPVTDITPYIPALEDFFHKFILEGIRGSDKSPETLQNEFIEGLLIRQKRGDYAVFHADFDMATDSHDAEKKWDTLWLKNIYTPVGNVKEYSNYPKFENNSESWRFAVLLNKESVDRFTYFLGNSYPFMYDGKIRYADWMTFPASHGSNKASGSFEIERSVYSTEPGCSKCTSLSLRTFTSCLVETE